MLDDTGAAAPTDHLLAEYTTAVRQLRATVRDAHARLDGVADILKKAAIVVRREHERPLTEPSRQPDQD